MKNSKLILFLVAILITTFYLYNKRSQDSKQPQALDSNQIISAFNITLDANSQAPVKPTNLSPTALKNPRFNSSFYHAELNNKNPQMIKLPETLSSDEVQKNLDLLPPTQFSKREALLKNLLVTSDPTQQTLNLIKRELASALPLNKYRQNSHSLSYQKTLVSLYMAMAPDYKAAESNLDKWVDKFVIEKSRGELKSRIVGLSTIRKEAPDIEEVKTEGTR